MRDLKKKSGDSGIMISGPIVANISFIEVDNFGFETDKNGTVEEQQLWRERRRKSKKQQMRGENGEDKESWHQHASRLGRQILDVLQVWIRQE